MLSTFRKASSSWLILGLLGLLMIAFIVTGFGTGGGGLGDIGGGPGRIATVGSEKITDQDMVNRLNRELKATQRDHPDMDMGRFIQIGAFEDMLDQEIINRSQLAFATEQNIAASKRLVDGEIAGEPAFQDAAGKFDENAFRAALGQAGIREADLRKDVQLDVVRRQLLMPISHGARLPSQIINYYAQLLLEVRKGAVGAIPTVAVGPGNQPTEPEIAAYYKANQAKYRIPERRVLRYALFGWHDIVTTVQATDAEIEAAYKQAAATYGPKETRDVAQLTLPDQAAANTFATKVKAGTSFTAAAAEAGFAAADIVRVEGTRQALAGKIPTEVADAAFKAGQGAIVGPVRSPLGWHVARIEKAAQVAGKPLAAVRNEIASGIQQRKAVDALEALVTKVEDQIGDGATFDEVVATNKLKAAETEPVTQAGAAPGTTYHLPAEVKALLKAGFELSTDDDPQVETITQGQSYAMVQVRRIVDPTVPPLAQVHDRIKADMITQRSRDRAKKLTDQLVAKINAGTPIREAFANAGVKLPPVQPVGMRRADANRAGDKLPPPIRVMFGLQKGKAGISAIPNGEGWFISVAEEITPGAAKDVPLLAQELKAPFDEFQSGEYIEQFIRSTEREVGVKRNDSAIAALKKRLQSGNAQ